MDSTISPSGELGAFARARLALLMMTAALCACGGGGGSSTPPPPPPPPAPTPVAPATLALKADAASVDAGGAPVGLHATLGTATTSITWGLQGPGTLSVTSGSDVQYIPPDADALDASQTATLSASNIFGSPTIEIAVAAVDHPGRHWTQARASSEQFGAIAQGNGGFLAVRFPTGFMRSPDGLTWTEVAANLTAISVTWGDAGWVAVSGQGTAWSSPDGITWTQAPDAIPSAAGGVVYGNHVYLAYGYNNSAVSSDGQHWTPVAQGANTIVFGNGQFMALQPSTTGSYYSMHTVVSTDGVNWQPATSLSNVSWLAFANGQFDMSYGWWVWASGDGGTWIGSDAAPNYKGWRLQGAGGALFELGSDDIGVQLPGAGWQRATTGDFLSLPAAIAANGDRYVGLSNNGWIETSADGLNWTTQVEGSYGTLAVIDVVDGQFVALSNLNHFMRSVDGAQWTKATLLSGLSAPTLYPMAIAHAGHTVVAAGELSYDHSGAGGPNGMWVRSLDGGTTWAQAATTGPAEPLTGVAYDGRRFVSISASGKVYTSADGDAWGQAGTAPAPLSRYLGIAYGGGVYLAFGDGVAATSADGVTWTSISAAAMGLPTSHLSIASAIWTGTQFVVAGRDPDASNANFGHPFAAVSADGHSWTTTIDAFYTVPTALAVCGNEIVGVGSDSITSSTDGLSWHKHDPVAGATQLAAVSCDSDRFVATGWSSAIVTSTR